MQVIYISHFIEAASGILSEFIGDDSLEVGEPKLRGEHHEIMDFAVIIGLTGDVEGRVVLDMNPQTALNMANHINGSTFEDPAEEMVQATAQEMGNMIAGRAITLLNELSCVFDITPPALMLGQNMVLSEIGHEIVSISLATSVGNIDLTLVLHEGE